MLKYLPALALILAAAPALAQSGATQTPPAPGSSATAPQPANSLPPGAANMNIGAASNPNVSGPIGATQTAPSTTGGVSAPLPAGSQPSAGTVPAPASR